VDFDVDEFLRQPLTAQVGTVTAATGPAVRPTWFLWEESAFWILTGPWSRLPAQVQRDPRVAVVVDVCDLATGLVRQVIASGVCELLAFDIPRGQRLLRRYLGAEEADWDSRFQRYLHSAPDLGTGWLRLQPHRLTAKDLSYRAA
jgi:hypothetical protein